MLLYILLKPVCFYTEVKSLQCIKYTNVLFNGFCIHVQCFKACDVTYQ